MLNHEQFKKAKLFIFSDIKRELDLVSAGNDGGNFLCALGLLCYTEFAGKIKTNSSNCKNNFNTFFASMGSDYQNLLRNNDIYNKLRCGLAHEYFVKTSCVIYMPAYRKKIGIKIDINGKYYFYVGKYFEDFKTAFLRLEKDIYNST